MDHALSMGLVQRIRDIDGLAEGLVERWPTFLQPVGSPSMYSMTRNFVKIVALVRVPDYSS